MTTVSKWKKVKIGEFLKRIKRPIQLDNNEYKLVTIKMNHNGVVLRETKPGFAIKSNMYEVKTGDFILSGIDARNGAFGIISEELDGAIVTNDFWYFDIDESVINKHLFLELTATTWFDNICKRGSDGTTQRIRLQKDKFFNQEITLPKPEYQEELLRKILTIKEILQSLQGQIEDKKVFIEKLKQAILQEAIQGKLTKKWREANPNVMSASELLKRIKAEKEALIKTRKIKKGKSLSPIKLEEIPFDLPDGWAWCRLGELINISSGDGLTSKQMIKGNIPVYGGNGITGYHNQHNTTEKTVTIGRVGANCGIVHLTPQFAWITDNCFRVYFNKDCIFQNYLIWQLQYMDLGTASYDGSQPVISGKRVYPLLTFFPPLEEQKAIVEKVDSLMKTVNELKSEIWQSKQYSNNLLPAVLREVFEG